MACPQLFYVWLVGRILPYTFLVLMLFGKVLHACMQKINIKPPSLEMFETMEITIVLQSTRQIITAQAYEDFKTTIRRSYDATGVQKLVIYYISRY